MEKLLKSSARVPETLYVKRAADIQLQKVIKEMLRPGYISVARQMGKTNLLQNAKREIEDSDNIIIYIDLSSVKYDNARQYFRSIIDTILEVNEESLSEARSAIYEKRIGQNFSASSEHDRELRIILKYIPQRLIIILDEVDALAKSDFSDEIFAQIRSIYFMRSTYVVLDKLSYILSGVIEPTKLIKNKDNSPFNIAEQIYLDDFSYDEFLVFISNSGLSFSDDVKYEIYNWTTGNPRMTYEVCSFLEDIIINKKVVTIENVNDAVYKLYLTDFNAAPIDHIRDIVANNSLIREGVKNIKKGENITDEIKDQLYLYGIINSKFKTGIISIKNKIIDHSLSDEWLIDIETKTKGFYEYGLEKISYGQHEEGIKYILRFAENPDISDIQKASALFSVADAYSKLGDYDLSNKYIQMASYDKTIHSNEYYYSILKKGINYYALNQVNESFNCFDEIISESEKNTNYYTALLNKAIFSVNKDFKINHIESLSIFETIIEEISQTKLPKDWTEAVLSLCYFRIANINQSLNKIQQAHESYIISKKYAAVELQPNILIGLIETSNDHDSIVYIDELYSLIISNKLKLRSSKILNIEFSENSLYQALIILYKYKKGSFSHIINHCIALHYQNNIMPYVLLYNAGYYNLARIEEKILSKEIFKLALSYDDIDSEYFVKSCQGVAASLETYRCDEFAQYISRAFEVAVKFNNYKNLTYLDLNTFALAGAYFRDLGQEIYAGKFLDFLLERFDDSDEIKITGDIIIVCYIKAGILFKSGDTKEGLKLYEKINRISKNFNQDSLCILSNSKDVQNIINEVEKILNKNNTRSSNSLKTFTTKISTRRQPIISSKIQRNSIVLVQYKDGRKLMGKYKKFETDLENGNCVLVS